MAAAVGMALALVAFVYGRSKLSAFAFDVPNPLRPEERNRLLVMSGAGIAAVVLVTWVLNIFLHSLPDAITYMVFAIALGASVAYFTLMFRSPKVTSTERVHLRAYIAL